MKFAIENKQTMRIRRIRVYVKILDLNMQNQSKKNMERTQYTEAILHQGHRPISTTTQPQFAVAFSIPHHDVIDLFEETAIGLGFEMIEAEDMYATAIKKSAKPTVFELLNCLSWWGQSNRINAVKLTILSNPTAIESKDKLCRVKALSEPNIQVLQLIEVFKEKMQKIKGVVPSKYMFESTYSEESGVQNLSNPFHLQSCAHFMFHKIITSQCKIKDNLEQSLREFTEAFKNVEESSLSLPTPLSNVIGIVKEVCEEISRNWAVMGDAEQMGLLMPYIKISVEKYIFDRTENILKAMYIHRDREITQKFNKKRQFITKSMIKQQILMEVLVNKNVREIEQMPNHNQSRLGIKFCQRACPQLQKIQQLSSPRQKIKHCNLMYAELKSFFFSERNMKYQLNSMEDIIPVFIVLVLLTEIPDFRSQLNLMIDFINAGDEEFEAEKRLLINLSESYNYVVRDWNIDF